LFTDALAILGAARQMSDPVAVAADKIASEIFPLTVTSASADDLVSLNMQVFDALDGRSM
jgi:hypothetical protein